MRLSENAAEECEKPAKNAHAPAGHCNPDKLRFRLAPRAVTTAAEFAISAGDDRMVIRSARNAAKLE